MTNFISKARRSGRFDFYPFNAPDTLRWTHARKWFLVSLITLSAASFDPMPDVIQIVAMVAGGFAAAILGVFLY